MKRFNQIFTDSKFRTTITYWCSVLVFISLFSSKFLLTLGMIGLISNAVLHPEILNFVRQFLKDKLALLLTTIFLIGLCSYVFSDNMGYWAERLRVKLPFLILPFALSSLLPLERKKFNQLLFIFWITIVGFCSYSVVHFMLNYETILQSYAAAHTLWTPKDHIRFSLAVACCVWVGIYLYRAEFFWKFKWEKEVYFYVSLLLVIYLHVLSVRSGLLGLYASAVYFILYFLLIKRKWKHALVSFVCICVLFAIAIFSSPTLKTKFGYMRYDINEFMQGKNVEGKSDAGRLMSQKIGWHVLKNNFWMGVGMGDVQDEVKKQYGIEHPEIQENQRLVPHNQFLFSAVGVGFLGGFFLLISLSLIFFQNNNYRKWTIGCIYTILFSSLFSESTLETQIGTAVFLFVILFIHYQFKLETEI